MSIKIDVKNTKEKMNKKKKVFQSKKDLQVAYHRNNCKSEVKLD